jgi:hypothetical protein
VRRDAAAADCPVWFNAHHSSQVITGQLGPRQYRRASKAGSNGLVLGGTGQRSRGWPANSADRSRPVSLRSWDCAAPPATSPAKPAMVWLVSHRPVRTS